MIYYFRFRIFSFSKENNALHSFFVLLFGRINGFNKINKIIIQVFVIIIDNLQVDLFFSFSLDQINNIFFQIGNVGQRFFLLNSRT